MYWEKETHNMYRVWYRAHISRHPLGVGVSWKTSSVRRQRITVLQFFIRFFFYVYGCFTCLLVSVPHACRAHRGQKRASNLPELELQKVVSSRVGAEKLTWVPWKSSQCSWPLSHLSRPCISILKCHKSRTGGPDPVLYGPPLLGPFLSSGFLQPSPWFCTASGHVFLSMVSRAL